MRDATKVFPLTALAAALLAVIHNPAFAAEEGDELSQYTQPSSSVSIGVGVVNKDRPQFGIYDGMRDKGAYLLFDADIQKRDNETGTWKTFSVKDFGLDNREIRAEYLEQGKQGVAVEYSQTQSNAPYTINTNQVGIGTATQTTGANITNAAIGSGTNYQFGTERDKLGFNIYKNLKPGLDLRIKLSSENKEGNRITSNGSALFVADLIDWKTQQAEVTLSYTGDDLQLSGGYLGSRFENKNSLGYVSLGSTVMTQPLDNQAHQAFLSGVYSFSPSTKGNFKLAYTRATQNEALPTASISSLSYANIPSLRGEVNTKLVQLGLSSRPMPKLSLVANLRYHDVQDKTPQYTSVANTTGAGANVTVNTTPYSYKTTSGKVEGAYDLSQGYSVIAGIDYSEQDRTVYTDFGGTAYQAYVPYRSKLDEASYRIQLRKSLSETLNGSLAYLYSDRGGSDMTTSTQPGGASTGSVNLVSPVHIADRERQKIRLALDWDPTDKLGFQLNLERSEDEYGTSSRSHGVYDGNSDLYSLDANYRLNDKWQMSGWYSYYLTDVHLRNYTTATNQILKQQQDQGDSLGFSLTGALNAKTKTGVEFSWSKDKSSFDQSYSNGSALAQVPNITTEVARIKLFAEYALQKNADLRFDVIFENWKSNDWQWVYSSGLAWQYGATGTDGTTVITDPKQNSIFYGARYTYKF
ncbi:MAG: MtrB/PioB family decaheme-associated outer membrane protein [Burkholderiales bacterium]|nr:MtrB/PioB family decaheme-associated outer membrane protein [Burkholderiales bacterium]